MPQNLCRCGPLVLGAANRAVYCSGPLLDAVQRSNMFPDCKTFVDMKSKYSPERVLADYELFRNCRKNDGSFQFLQMFVEKHFLEKGTELEQWTPPDWKCEPPFTKRIADPDLRKFAVDLNGLWKVLGRRMKDEVKENPEKHSIVYVPNPVIVPGGRFIEFYYWDSLWIIRGLLLCGMHDTARGMIDNFLSIVRQYGFVPNGGRIYYYGRSQPPMLIHMMKSYVDITMDEKYAIQSLPQLETEFDNFIEKHQVQVKGRTMYHYKDCSTGPRPESYREDVASAADFLSEPEKERHYTQLKSACESGMDFSSRWFIARDGTNRGTLKDIQTTSIVPVELNVILFRSAKILVEFNRKAGNTAKVEEYSDIACGLVKAVRDVLWNEEAGIWLDYDLLNNKPRPYFSASNFSPLWARAYPLVDTEKIARGVMNYIKTHKLDDYPGGVPNTMNKETGQQWDYPNVWPPMMFMIIDGLYNLGTPEARTMSERWAHRWVKNNYEAYSQTGFMFEKYNCEKFGSGGGGGEYQNQTGFGWTNGIILEYLFRYGQELSLEDSSDVHCKCKAGKASKAGTGGTLSDCPETSDARMDPKKNYIITSENHIDACNSPFLSPISSPGTSPHKAVDETSNRMKQSLVANIVGNPVVPSPRRSTGRSVLPISGRSTITSYPQLEEAAAGEYTEHVVPREQASAIPYIRDQSAAIPSPGRSTIPSQPGSRLPSVARAQDTDIPHSREQSAAYPNTREQSAAIPSLGRSTIPSQPGSRLPSVARAQDTDIPHSREQSAAYPNTREQSAAIPSLGRSTIPSQRGSRLPSVARAQDTDIPHSREQSAAYPSTREQSAAIPSLGRSTIPSPPGSRLPSVARAQDTDIPHSREQSAAYPSTREQSAAIPSLGRSTIPSQPGSRLPSVARAQDTDIPHSREQSAFDPHSREQSAFDPHTREQSAAIPSQGRTTIEYINSPERYIREHSSAVPSPARSPTLTVENNTNKLLILTVENNNNNNVILNQRQSRNAPQAVPREQTNGTQSPGQSPIQRESGIPSPVDYTASTDPYSPEKSGVDPYDRDQSTVDPYNREKVAADPYNTEQHSADPYSREQSTADPYNREKSAADPYNREQSTADPYSREKSAVDPYNREQSTADPHSREKSAADPYNREQSTADPYSREKSAVDPYNREQSTEDPYNREKSAADPYNREQSTADPYSREKSAVDPYNREQSTADPYSREKSAVDPYNREQSTADPYNREKSAADPYNRDQSAAGPYSREQSVADPYNQERSAADPYTQEQSAEDPYPREQGPVDPYKRPQLCGAPNCPGQHRILAAIPFTAAAVPYNTTTVPHSREQDDADPSQERSPVPVHRETRFASCHQSDPLSVPREQVASLAHTAAGAQMHMVAPNRGSPCGCAINSPQTSGLQQSAESVGPQHSRSHSGYDGPDPPQGCPICPHCGGIQEEPTVDSKATNQPSVTGMPVKKVVPVRPVKPEMPSDCECETPPISSTKLPAVKLFPLADPKDTDCPEESKTVDTLCCGCPIDPK
ncbi:uncharacterized protein LOC117188236 [Drosophila miranda]|uniref:uncharacterized protein LOC117188236 n=1 Tax=Drosophila miranda TaxID=7229 RepID=UPI00143F58A8|nr:uncharacterized protein LOC117188236 [Drosophila miranda]